MDDKVAESQTNESCRDTEKKAWTLKYDRAYRSLEWLWMISALACQA